MKQLSVRLHSVFMQKPVIFRFHIKSFADLTINQHHQINLNQPALHVIDLKVCQGPLSLQLYLRLSTNRVFRSRLMFRICFSAKWKPNDTGGT